MIIPPFMLSISVCQLVSVAVTLRYKFRTFSGAAAMMAIRVLLDHDVPEEKIVLLSLLMASPGIQSIAYAFPSVKMVTTAADATINEDYHIIPGIGNFGDRYFGTDDAFEHEVDEW